MRWDRFFEDLEEQLASEWEAERAALDSEAERLRLSKVTLRERMTGLLAAEAEAVIEFSDRATISGRLVAVGDDWIAASAPATLAVAPLASVRSVAVSHEELLRSARPAPRRTDLADRMTFGFVMRDAARRRIPVTLHVEGERALTGTIDRAGVDHLDLALHDAEAPRRVRDVIGYRLVPFTAIAWVRWDAARSVLPG